MVSILIVDDEKKICEFIKAFLDNEGYCTDEIGRASCRERV